MAIPIALLLLQSPFLTMALSTHAAPPDIPMMADTVTCTPSGVHPPFKSSHKSSKSTTFETLGSKLQSPA
jgi:hypothetical protein